jgi:hypothetical protein
MKQAAHEYVTLAEVLEITGPFEQFAAAVDACVRRLEAEGVRELVTIQFYANPGSPEVGALLTFADRERVVEHLNLIMRWQEFERFFSMVTPRDVRIYGQLSAEAEAWVRQFDVISKTFDQHVTGFVR